MKPFTSHLLGIVCSLVFCLFGPLLYGQTYSELVEFNSIDNGSNPLYPGLIAQGQDGNLYSTLQSGGPKYGLGTVYAYPLGGGLVDVLYNFNGTDGNGPMSGLSLGFDGNFYGTTYLPHGSEFGEVFKITPEGTLTVLYQFSNGTDGAYPQAPPIQAPDGNLYGVTFNGTVPTAYRISPSGAFSVIANLPSKTNAPLILGTDGNLYGTTPYGGTYNRGTAFQLTTKGKLKIIHNFGDATGALPASPLMQASDGKLYGTAPWGGTSSGGVIYSMTKGGGGYKVLHNLVASGSDGSGSTGGLVQGSDNWLYGAMPNGGALGYGTFFRMNTKGTTYTVLHNFDKASGGSPLSTPLLHTSGVIYGMAENSLKQGALYSMDVGLPSFASLFVIWSGKVGTSVGILGQGFNSATGVKFGTGPGTFTVVSDTYLIAAPAAGATTGTVTVLEPGGNLVTPQTFNVLPTISGFSPKSGPVGTQVVITGTSLKQTSSVTIGKAKATFTVNSDSQVTATVAAGAVTGKVSLKTKGGTATGPGKFTVN